jgi:hypothetical protein
MAQNDDSEMRTRLSAKNELKATTVDGSFGKRLVRNLSILTRDLTTEAEKEKGKEYGATKEAVHATLKEIYGDELGTKVYRANIGHMQGDQHIVSHLHPITGRHIRKMMEQGDRELLARYADPKTGGVKLDRDMTSGMRAPGATLAWMKSLSPGDGPSDKREGMELRTSRLPIRDVKGRDSFGEIAETVFRDADKQLEKARRAFWTLDVGVGETGKFDRTGKIEKKHPIGICIDADDENMVQVYDGNIRSATVSRKDFGAWLAAHVNAHYDMNRVELHRAGLARDSYFWPEGDGWVRKISWQQSGVDEELRKNFQMMNRECSPGKLTCKTFDADVDRDEYRIKFGRRDFVLRAGNSERLLSALVEGGSEAQRRTAVYNLSMLLNQNLGNAPNDLIGSHLRSEIHGWPPSVIVQMGTEKIATLSRINGEEAGKDTIRIDVGLTQGLGFVEYRTSNQEYLDPGSSWTVAKYSIVIPLQALWTKGGLDEFTASPLTVEIRATLGDEDQLSKPKLVALQSRDGRFVSARQLGFDRADRVLHESKSLPGQVLGNRPSGLTESGSRNLSRLVSPQTAKSLCASMYSAITDQVYPNVEQPELRTKLRLKPEDEPTFAEIEYRYSLEEPLPGVVLFHGSERPEGDGRLETVVTVRVPFQELNEGVPLHYDFVHSPRLEWTPQ